MKIVLALGGNALGSTYAEQTVAVCETARAVVALAAQGHQIAIAHGNGPQVGMIQQAFDPYTASKNQPPLPLPVDVAMSQAYIGYALQQALRDELRLSGSTTEVATVLTQVVVDEADPAFQNPTKPIGLFMTEEAAHAFAAATGATVKEDAGRGWRQVVASPKPVDLVEKESIRLLTGAGVLVIACGGGGIPVVKDGDRLRGVPAVIDKDFAAETMAELLNADLLMILTAVERVAIRFGKPDQQEKAVMTCAEALRYADAGEFAPGSMLPKVQAAVRFAQSQSGRVSIIASLQQAEAAFRGESGTKITL